MSAAPQQVLLDEIPHVPSPYTGQSLGAGQHIRISAYWFATNMLWGALLVIMLPGQIRDMAPYLRIPALSILTGLAAVVALVVPLIVGAYSDRCASRLGRRRPFMIWGVAINLLGLALMAVVHANAEPLQSGQGASLAQSIGALFAHPGFVLYLLAYMVVQLGNNVASAAYSGIIPDLVPPDQRGAASGYMAFMSQFGTLVGAVASGALLGGQPEWVKFAAIGGVLLSVALVTILGIQETPLPHCPPRIRWGAYIRSLWIDPRQYPDFAWVWITRAMVMLGFYSVLPFINYYLVDVIGIERPEGSASLLIGILLIASSISGIYGGYVSDRVGRKRVVYVANLTIAVMVLGFVFCRELWHVLLVGVFFGLGFGAYTSVDWALGTDVLPTKTNAAKEMAIWHIAMTLPQSIAGPFAGFLIASFGMSVVSQKGEDLVHYTAAGYTAVFVLCALCFAAGAYFLKNVRGAT